MSGKAEWTLREAYEKGKLPELEKQNVRRSTRQDYATHLRRWDEYWSNRSGGPAPTVDQVKRRHLEEWRDWLAETLRGRNVPLNVNKHLRSIRAILAWCERQEIIIRAPAVDRLPAKTVADKYYLTYEQLDRLYESCGQLTWPDRDQAGAPLPYSTAEGWRAAIVLFFHYGFRTQELVRYETDHSALPWRQIAWEAETPAQDGHAENEWGWFWYVPQKQRRRKPQPLILPMNHVVHAHVQSIRPESPDPEVPLFNWPLSSEKLYREWSRLCEVAEVIPKRNILTGEQPRYQLRHFRKTATTWLNRHRPGIAPLITGHADRDLTTKLLADSTLSAAAVDGGLSRISADHYDNSEIAVVEALRTLPMPNAFDKILAKGP